MSVKIIARGSCVSKALLLSGTRELQCEEGCIGLGIGDDCLLPHEFGERGVEVEGAVESGYGVRFGDVAAVAGEETVICKGVHHGTRAAD